MSYNKQICYAHTLKFPEHEIDYKGVEVIDNKLQIKDLLLILKKQPKLYLPQKLTLKQVPPISLIVIAYYVYQAEQE